MHVCIVAGTKVSSVFSLPRTLPNGGALWSMNGNNYIVQSDTHVQCIPLGKLSVLDIKNLYNLVTEAEDTDIFLELGHQRPDNVLIPTSGPDSLPELPVTIQPKVEKSNVPRVDLRRRQPGAPKKAMNAYMHYLASKRAETRTEDSKLPPGFICKFASAWRAMNAEERSSFTALEAADRGRYQREMLAYNTSIMIPLPVISPEPEALWSSLCPPSSSSSSESETESED